MAEYDEIYNQTENVFGTQSTLILERFFHLINKNKRVLDIGAGQGRNSIFLAKNGFKVDAIDPSRSGIEVIKAISQKENLSINSFIQGFSDFNPANTSYSAILLFGIIQVITRKELERLIKKINKWTEKGDLLFVTAHSVKDQKYYKYSKEMKSIGKNSFSDGKIVRTFLEEKEILNFFGEWGIEYHFEGYGPEHRHGAGPVERHYVIEGIFRKK